MAKEVLIDGVRYAPVTQSSPVARQIAIELVSLYMGEFPEDELDRLATELTVYIGEDNSEPTIDEVVGGIMSRLEQQQDQSDRT